MIAFFHLAFERSATVIDDKRGKAIIIAFPAFDFVLLIREEELARLPPDWVTI